MKTQIILAVALAVSPAWGDEMLLKDGKTVAWKALSDEGDSYEVTLVQGTKITVKKSDVERLVCIKPAAPALTGATFTFDKKKKMETIDLLMKVDTKKDTVVGNWKLDKTGLTASCAGMTTGRMHVGVTPPEEYDLIVTAIRKDGVDELGVGIIGGGQQCEVLFDANKSLWSGVYLIDGKNSDVNGTGIRGRFFVANTPKTFTIMVRKEALIVQTDGKDYITWKADWSRVSVFSEHAVPERNVLFLQCYNSVFTVTQLKLVTPKN